MRVEDIMSREVQRCRPDESLHAAASIMWRFDIGCVPVVDEEGCLLGIITDRDICVSAYNHDVRLSELRVAHAMTRDVQACSPRDTLAAAEGVMQLYQVRRTPVVDAERHVVGMLSLNDLARAAVRPLACSEGLTPTAVGRTLAVISEPTFEPGSDPHHLRLARSAVLPSFD